jgi:hypothetical protein
MQQKKKARPRLRVLIAATVALALLIGAAVAYLGTYYRADTTAIEAFGTVAANERTLADGTMVFGTGEEEIGFLFYPGGKVDHISYVPLMRALAAKGIFAVLIPMPCRLAVLDSNAADGICEQFPTILRWYIGGHSLGGSMAGNYYAKHSDKLSGLVLLGAYVTTDISSEDCAVLSIFGSEDGVMNRAKYDKYRTRLPGDYQETVIEGGCHAYFGMYGAQKGDGTPTITAAEQIRKTAERIAAFTRVA